MYKENGVNDIIKKSTQINLDNSFAICFEGSLNLDATYVPLPFAYDAMKEAYLEKDETKCGMIVSIDYLNQCADSNRSNNLAIFPIKLVVDNVTGNI